MLGEIMSGTRTYNIVIAQLYGINVAIYIDAILNVYENKTMSEIKLCRKTIENYSSLSTREQKDAQSKLESVGIIKVIDTDKIIIDFSKLYSQFTLSSNEIELIKATQKEDKKIEREKSKKQYYVKGVLTKLKPTTPEIDELYGELVTVIFDKFGTMSGVQLEIIQNKLSSYSNNDLSKLKELLNISISNGYRDMNWTIKRYEELHTTHEETKIFARDSVSNLKDVVF